LVTVCQYCTGEYDKSKGERKMAIKVFIRRKVPKDKEKELFNCIQEIRGLVPQQAGYISSEYLKTIDDTNEFTTVSTWFSLDDWYNWLNSEQRLQVQAKIDMIPGITTEYSIYRYIKTR